jgi:lipoyl(octanoyl) transferase
MDLTPFDAINPCGYAGLKITQLRDHGVRDSLESVNEKLTHHLLEVLHG